MKDARDTVGNRRLERSAAMTTLPPVESPEIAEAINLLKAALEIYDRIHHEMEDGVKFEALDNGLSDEARKWTYPMWQGYMTQTIINCARGLVLENRIAKLEDAVRELNPGLRL